MCALVTGVQRCALPICVEQILADVSGVPQALSPALHGAASQAGHGRRRLLIVDDSSVARRNMEEIAKRLGLVYTLAHDGAQALDKIGRASRRERVCSYV